MNEINDIMIKKKPDAFFSHEMNSTYADKVEYFTTIVRGVTSCC